jgi:hypothetical protein
MTAPYVGHHESVGRDGTRQVRNGDRVQTLLKGKARDAEVQSIRRMPGPVPRWAVTLRVLVTGELVADTVTEDGRGPFTWR